LDDNIVLVDNIRIRLILKIVKLFNPFEDFNPFEVEDLSEWIIAAADVAHIMVHGVT
jgi:hypothetical protein